jgi:hypothetical protein
VSWEGSILAMGVALGVPLDEVATWIPREDALLLALRSNSKAERTKALALALGAIAKDIEELELA